MSSPRFSPGDILICPSPQSQLNVYQVLIISNVEPQRIYYYSLFFVDIYLFVTNNNNRSLDTIRFVESSLYPHHYSAENITPDNLTPESLAKLHIKPRHQDISKFEDHEILSSMDQFKQQAKCLEAYTKPGGAFPAINPQDFENIHTLFYDNIFSPLFRPQPLPLPPTITL